MFLHILLAPEEEEEEEEGVTAAEPISLALTGAWGGGKSPRPSMDIHVLSKDAELAHLEAGPSDRCGPLAAAGSACVRWADEGAVGGPPPEGVEVVEDVEENVSELCLLRPWGSARTTLGSGCCVGGGEAGAGEAGGTWP